MKRKVTPILAALAVTLSALASTAMAVETFTYDAKGNLTHIKGIPVEPIPTVEQARAATEKRIAEIKAEEAKQAAQAATTSNLQSEIGNHQLFYTGKPYLEETGQYLFLFRHYDPELARWTTADPSGFPDGANNIAYMAVPTSEVDWQGLWSVRITSSQNTVSDSTSYVDGGIIWDTVISFLIGAQATNTSAMVFAVGSTYDVNNFTGSIGNHQNQGAQRSVSIGVNSNGYLIANVPNGVAHDLTNELSSGVSISGIGFDGNSRTGTITVTGISAYKTNVTYSASAGGLSVGSSSNSYSMTSTWSFNYEAVE